MLKRLGVTVEEALLVLAGKGHDEGAPREIQVHHKDLHGLAAPCDNGNGFSPVALGILARFKLKWDVDIGGMAQSAPLRAELTNARFASLIAFSLDDLKDLADRVTLLAWQMFVES